jgi:hypothetical protein
MVMMAMPSVSKNLETLFEDFALNTVTARTVVPDKCGRLLSVLESQLKDYDEPRYTECQKSILWPVTEEPL